MTRDDSSGGWVPVSGGGLSYVALVCHKVMLDAADDDINSGTSVGVEFVIQGRRVADHEVRAVCNILVYMWVSKTFIGSRVGMVGDPTIKHTLQKLQNFGRNRQLMLSM